MLMAKRAMMDELGMTQEQSSYEAVCSNVQGRDESWRRQARPTWYVITKCVCEIEARGWEAGRNEGAALMIEEGAMRPRGSSQTDTYCYVSWDSYYIMRGRLIKSNRLCSINQGMRINGMYVPATLCHVLNGQSERLCRASRHYCRLVSVNKGQYPHEASAYVMEWDLMKKQKKYQINTTR